MSHTNRVNGIVTGNNQPKYGQSGSNPVIVFLTGRFTKQVYKMIDHIDTPITSILDVGAGEGTMAANLAAYTGAQVTGFDLPDPELQAAWEANDSIGELVTGDAHELPFEDNSFDLVVGLEVLEHVRDPHQVLAEITRVAKHKLLLSVPNEPFFRMGNLFTGRHVKSLGNTPGHWNHWASIGFYKHVSAHAAIDATATPFPWTMVLASPDL